ncbi:hypothetical protein SAMN05444487_104219 [Marininema mesophilum]|uniref:Uncharacterized protein n=1 Tax=Marininema mesophilum TaxID=1048340 RepID=A0A1H2UTH9_9BACL|nr:hypothetical protein [Marininema mesophilum]SDW59453.1 hypothetical protein SAMN05444487_104219 [Marininema mesophilum]
MNFADRLTYADIELLQRMASHYGCGQDVHSKKDLITSLLHHLAGKSRLSEELGALTAVENRFLQQVCLDNRAWFNREELLSKGRIALGDEKGEPRRLVISAIHKGWLFPGISQPEKDLLQMPSDLRKRFLSLFAEKYERKEAPAAYRNEEDLISEDLQRFCTFLCRHEVRLSADGGIYRQQQRQLFQSLHIQEEPVNRKEWRFGFGRSFHLYPDRFALLYDYAFFRGYIAEDEIRGCLYLTELGAKKMTDSFKEEGKELYRFWLRLYKTPLPHLALVVKWIELLCRGTWQGAEELYQGIKEWISPYYYESEENLFNRVLKMMLHLGMIRIGESVNKNRLITMNVMGAEWVSGVAGFAEKSLAKKWSEPAGGRNLRVQGGNKVPGME